MRAKKVQKKRYQPKESGIEKYNNEIIGILVFAFGILCLLSFFFEQAIGVFGTFIRGLFTGLMGLPAFLLPPMLIVYSVFIIFKKDNSVLRLRMLYTVILLILISSLIQAGFYHQKDFVGLSTLNSMKKFFEDGKSLAGGGLFGGLVSIPFLATFQVLGTIIIITTIAIIDIILLTNISIANFITNIKSFFTTRFKSSKNEQAQDETPETGFEPDVVGRDEDLSLQFRAEPKVIDLKIEKAARELKEKTNKIAGKKIGKRVEEIIEEDDLDTDVEPELEIENEPIQFIMKDVKKSLKPELRPAENLPEETEVKKEEKKTKNTDKELNEEISIAGEIEKTASTETSIEYRYPPVELLNENMDDGLNIKEIRNSALEGAKKLEETLKSFGVEARVNNVSRGPAVTRYELQPSPGVKVSKIVNLADDISLNLASAGVRIEAPIPGKAAVGIEVPNKEVTAVFLREVIESPEFDKYPSKLAFALGKDISGDNIVTDIAKMPHVLIAGSTGSGKSVCINSLIISLLYKASPDEVKLLMVDPKVVELGIYNGIPHLLIPVVTDPKKAAGALNWAVQEMVNRYKLFAEKGVRDIKGYNAMLKETGAEGVLPQIVIIIDELADLMMVAPNDVEDAICRLAQMARAAGMHLVIATQRPSVDVITGVIKANIPSRIAFAVSSQVDSRTILDMAGAEKLLGKGDMLFYPVGEPKPIRIKGAFVSDKEVEKVVDFIKSQGKTEYDANIIEEINSENEPVENNPGDNDELLNQAIDMVVEAGQASVSLIQRKFKVGYARAARIVDQMEERGIVGRFEGSKPRQVLISRQQWNELQMAKNE